MEDLGVRLLVKVAQLYHVQGLNQDQIGRQLGLSRSKVSRLLKEARERKLVEISIRYPPRFSLDLERRLEAELGLRDAVVVKAGDAAGGQLLCAVARAASDYLVRALQPGDVLGVSGGETVALTAQMLPAATVQDLSVAQLGTAVTNIGEGAAFSSAEVALQLAQKLGSLDHLVLIPVPSLLDNEAIRDALLRDTGVQRAMTLLARCTVALVGIGTLEALATKVEPPSGQQDGGAAPSACRPCPRRLPPVTEAEVTELRRAGAVGEISARFFDIDGWQCVTSLDRRMVALDLHQLKTIPSVIGVACGSRKAAAILGAVRGGYVKSLITDDITAAEVLALAGTATASPRGRVDRDVNNECGSTAQVRWQPSRRASPSSVNGQLTHDQRVQGQAPLAHG